MAARELLPLAASISTHDSSEEDAIAPRGAPAEVVEEPGAQQRARPGPLPRPFPGHARCIRLAMLAGRCPVMPHYRTRVFFFPLRFASRGHHIRLRVACSLRCAATFNVTPGATLNAAGRAVRARRGRGQLRALRGAPLKGARTCARKRARSTRLGPARRARPRSWRCSLRSGGKALAVRVRLFRFGRLRALRVLGHLRGHAPASAEYDEGTGESRASGALRAPPRGRRPGG